MNANISVFVICVEAIIYLDLFIMTLFVYNILKKNNSLEIVEYNKISIC